MSADSRIKGQDVEVIAIENGDPILSLQNIRSFEMAAQLETLNEEYLGESTTRRDEKYNGVRGRFDLHVDTPDIFDFVRSIIDRARRVPGANVTINIKATLLFPSGRRSRVLIRNVFFGEIPLSFGSRSDYGAVTIDFEAQDFKPIN